MDIIPGIASKRLWLLVFWLFAGLVLFYFLGHHRYLFPIALFAWLIVLAVWYGSSRWKWSTIVVAPTVAALVCVPAAYVHAWYSLHQAERALEEYIQYIRTGESSLNFAVELAGGTSQTIMEEDFVDDYLIVGRDTFGVEYEWAVQFANGAKYSIDMVHISVNHWEVEASRVPRRSSLQRIGLLLHSQERTDRDG